MIAKSDYFSLLWSFEEGNSLKGILCFMEPGSDSENAERCLTVSFITICQNTIVITEAMLFINHDSYLFVCSRRSHRIITEVEVILFSVCRTEYNVTLTIDVFRDKSWTNL